MVVMSEVVLRFWAVLERVEVLNNGLKGIYICNRQGSCAWVGRGIYIYV